MSMQNDQAAAMAGREPGSPVEVDALMERAAADGSDGEVATPDTPATSGPEAGGATSGDAEGTDPEALSHEREEYPDPQSYPPPDTADGATPDPDLQVDDPSGGEQRHGRQ